MRRCAFLTLADPSDFVIDDHLAYAPLAARGWRVDAVPWNRPDVKWEGYDLVVIRSPWDYTRDPEGFLAVLADIDRRGVRLENALRLVRWNLDKSYLRDLDTRGVEIVPTLWRERLAPGELADLFEEVGSDEMVIKPVVGANAEGAFRLDAGSARERAPEVEAHYADRALMAQPFARAVLDEGEYSLFYFNGVYSHNILKTPKAGDFRVQEEHGGVITAARPDPELRRAGRAAHDAVGEVPLYLRADFVRAGSGDGYWLIELELVEPSLYLRIVPEAPASFASAIDARFDML